MCLVDISQRGDFDFDVVVNGRYHHEQVRRRRVLESYKTKKSAQNYCRDTNLTPEAAPPCAIALALNLILGRPSDPAHSEYGGMSKQLHLLLINSILVPQAVTEYIQQLRAFPFPPSWARLQSPTFHLKSYILQKHARWSIICPVLLQTWLKSSHVQRRFLNSLGAVLRRPGATDKKHVSSIVIIFAMLAASNTVFMGQRFSEDEKAKIFDLVKAARRLYQTLFEAAALSSIANLRSRRSITPSTSRAASSSSSRSTTPGIPSILSSAPNPAQPGSAQISEISTTKSEEHRADKRRPNVHIGLHYQSTADEYGLLSRAAWDSTSTIWQTNGFGSQ